ERFHSYIRVSSHNRSTWNGYPPPSVKESRRMNSTLSLRLAAIAVSGLLITGCATQQQNRTAMGTGAGAALGAGLGALIGDSSEAAMIGAGIGAVAGGVAGYNWDRIKGDINQSGADEMGIDV